MNRLFIIATLVLLVLTGCAAPQETQDTLTVGLECNYAPFNWTQVQDTDTALPIDGDSASFCDGYDVSIAQHIADELDHETTNRELPPWARLAYDGQLIEVPAWSST